ncbi:MAG: hypothetical protein D6712_12145 [Chloroflexi bacterium]|nr:MAG: hypothetical protein D6712_12145 [Chloroflexota bacterium]
MNSFMWKHYFTVSSLQEALDLLAQYRERARIIAGGTDLLLELERHQRPDVDVVIDLTRVAGLDEITFSDNAFHLGPLVTHNHVIADSAVIEKALPLAQACLEVGAPQIRNRATVAGNVITASPANDTIPALMVLDAQITLASANGERTVSINEFYTGLRKTVMQPDELLTGITVPALKDNQRGIFIKLGLRRAQAISVVNIAVVLTFDGDIVQQAAIALGSVAPTVIRVPQAEQALVGKQLTSETISDIARLTASIPKPIDDVRSSAAYRAEMVKVITARALRALAEDTQADGWPQGIALLWGQSDGHVQNSLPEQVHHHENEPVVIETTVNGRPYIARTGWQKNLLRFLRDDLGLTGTKEGCAEGECGACTVFLDGVAVMACLVPAPRAHGANIVTIEGLQDDLGHLHPIQEAFVEEAAVQCGYCTPGFLMAGAKLLEEAPTPTREQIEMSISGNLCRCTGYYKIISAFEQAAKKQST